MAKHHPDLIMCRKQPRIAIWRLCEKCGGKCVICDSYVHPCTLVRVCDECNYESFQGWCVIYGGVGSSDTMIDSDIYIEMKKEQKVESKKNREWICLYREAEDEIHALLHYCFCLSVYITHPQFIYAVLERYHTENIHSI